MSLSYRTILVRLLIGVMLSALALSCKQYEYASPLPGIVEVRLKVVNSRTDFMPFGPFNRFGLSLKELNAVEPNGFKQPIYADLHALGRNPDGDLINMLDTIAGGGNLVLGQAYAPPGAFTGVEIRIGGFDPAVLIINAQFGFINQILVNPPLPPAPPTPTFYQMPEPPATTNITVSEGRLTVVTLGINLDSVLVRRSEYFEIHPSFSVLSVQNN